MYLKSTSCRKRKKFSKFRYLRYF